MTTTAILSEDLYSEAHTLGFVTACIKTNEITRQDTGKEPVLTVEVPALDTEDFHILVHNTVDNKTYKLRLELVDG